MTTLVLLVLLAIVWAGVGVYWLRTRVPSSPSLSFGGGSRRPPMSLGGGRARGLGQIVPLGAGRSSDDEVVGFGRFPATQANPVRSTGRPMNGQTQTMGHSSGMGLGIGRTTNGVSSSQARLRRRNVLVSLIAAAALTLFGVLAIGGTTLVLVHLVCDALLLGFVLAIVQYQREVEHQQTLNRPVYAAPRRRLAATGTDDAVVDLTDDTFVDGSFGNGPAGDDTYAPAGAGSHADHRAYLSGPSGVAGR